MMHAAKRTLLLAALLIGQGLAGQDRVAAGQARDARPDAAPGASARSADISNPARSYRSGGRRDPFLRPSRGGPPEAVEARPPGLAGIAVGETTLRGLVRLDGVHLAILETDGGRSHVVRGGEELFDGCVQSVTADGVVIVVDGPRGAARAVRLTLRPSKEGR